MALQMDFKTRTAAVFLQNADFQNCPFVQYSKIDFVCLKNLEFQDTRLLYQHLKAESLSFFAEPFVYSALEHNWHSTDS